MHLLRTEDRALVVDALSDRVGLDGVLEDLNREARVRQMPGRAAVWGFGWDDEDDRSRRWFPQGITSSADADASERYAGRQLLCTSWYSKTIRWSNHGARITFVDITDRGAPRYRHVLLVDAVRRRLTGGIGIRPLRIHAGGLVWHGEYLHAAGTRRGLLSFRLDDIIRVPAEGRGCRLRLRKDGRVDGFGHRYLLPVRFGYDAFTDAGAEPMRYSFCSLDQSSSPPHLVAGEYGKQQMTTRLVRYELDPETSLPATGADGCARPVRTDHRVVGHMQGAVVVDGTYYVTTSNGAHGRGSLWVGQPGNLTKHADVLPVGPEDLTYWPSTDQLWSLTEYPARRYVYAMDRPPSGRVG